MPKLSHTPKPWRVVKPASQKDNAFWIHSKSSHIATVKSAITQNMSFNEEEANANLIAAAPDLLEALEFVFSCIACGALKNEDGETPDFYEIEQAITKAKGEQSEQLNDELAAVCSSNSSGIEPFAGVPGDIDDGN